MNDKPFVKLFKSPNDFYMFDVNRNDIVKISKELYLYLLDLLYGLESEISKPSSMLLAEVSKLEAEGYLSDNRIEVMKHPLTDYVNTLVDRSVDMITLQLTQNCNLRCSYCVYSEMNNDKQRSHSSKIMSLTTAKKAIDFLAMRSIDSEKVNVGFYGGEPLLEFELLQAVVSYAEEVFSGKTLTFNITVNGTLLSPAVIEYCIEKNIAIMISIDGPKDIHDANRRFAADGRGSFDSIMCNINYFKLNYPDRLDKIMLSMVIDPQNEFDDINAISENEFLKDVTIRASLIDDIYNTEKITFSDKYSEQKEYNMFLAYLANFSNIDTSNTSPILLEEVMEIKTKLSKFNKTKSLPREASHGGPCLPGKDRLLIDVDGVLFPCERVSESSKVMQIGNLDEGFDYDKVSTLLNIVALTPSDCQNCWAFNHCTLCAKYCDNGDNLSADLKITYCHGVKERTMELFKNIVMINEIKDVYKEKIDV
ncbi:MAG: Cys-rich peptide radical SAM maturase CcpM [Lachnospiraceae bacterium]|nr:Cys-rich peptide radical SAM maturase CcpM [Lachnospiraceae bacterium]